jgi:hypothetical protein
MQKHDVLKKLNFIQHIDSLISKASKMLGYIQRVGREFKDPYTLRSLYFAFVRSTLEYACCVWSPFYEIHKRRIENIQKRFVRFALTTLRWNPDLAISTYCQRRQLLGLDFLSHRRQLYAAMFVCDVLCARLDCLRAPRVMSHLDIIIYRYDVRNTVVLMENNHRTNYGKYAPLEAAKKEFNRFSAIFDHGASRVSQRNYQLFSRYAMHLLLLPLGPLPSNSKVLIKNLFIYLRLLFTFFVLENGQLEATL